MSAEVRVPCAACGGRGVPRVARSLDDLRVGQVVAWRLMHSDEWTVSTIASLKPGDWEFQGTEVILSDPPPEPVSVSRETFDRLAKDVRRNWQYGIADAARALVNEVENQ